MIKLLRTETQTDRGRRATLAEYGGGLNWSYAYDYPMIGVDPGVHNMEFAIESADARFTVHISARAFNAGLTGMLAVGFETNVIDPAELARAIIASPKSAAVLAELHNMAVRQALVDIAAVAPVPVAAVPVIPVNVPGIVEWAKSDDPAPYDPTDPEKYKGKSE